AEMRVASALLGMSIGKQMALMLTPIVAFILATFALLALLGHHAMPAILMLVGILMTYMLAFAMTPSSIRIGTDGILTRWFGRERFFPFSSIAFTDVYDEYIATKRQHGVRLTLRNGEIVNLPTGQMDIGAAEAKRLGHRIEEARAARSA